MLILVSIPKKSSFCANEKFIDFQTTLKGTRFSPVGAMGNFAEGQFFWLGGGNLTRSDFDHLNLF